MAEEDQPLGAAGDSDSPPTLDDLVPHFSSDGDPAVDFAELAQWIEAAEWVLRLLEFAEVGEVKTPKARYSIRVYGGEKEAPHVHITAGHDREVRIFLGSSPDDITVVNGAGEEGFGATIRNRVARDLLRDYVEAHHSCLLRAWTEHGNPIHDPGAELSVDCDVHGGRTPPELRGRPLNGLLATPDLNAHPIEEHAALHRRLRLDPNESAG